MTAGPPPPCIPGVRHPLGAPWYLLRGKSRMVERAEVLRMVQASYEEAEDKDQMAENLLMLLGFRPKDASATPRAWNEARP